MADIKLRKADPIDIHVGERLRLRRSLLGISQEQLARNLKVSFQQLQKYERGINRMSASRLYELGNLLDIPLTYFYEHLPQASNDVAPLKNVSHDIMKDKETVNLINAYYEIKDPEIRKSIFTFIKGLSDKKHAAKRNLTP